MKALSVRQPWAWLITQGYKDVENRVWRTHFRGPVLIHASKGMTRHEYDDVAEMLAVPGNEWIGQNGPLQLPDRRVMERGGIVGVATIVDCVESSRSPWFNGPYGFVLADVRPTPLIPFAGTLGYFDVPDSLVAEALKHGR